MCGNYSREEFIQGRKLYEEKRYFGDLKNASHFPKKLTMIETYFGFMRLEDMKNLGHIALIA